MPRLVHAACGLALLLAGATAIAQDYPNRPVQMLVSFPAGSIVDLMARPFAQVAEQVLGQRIVVVNRAGGSQTIAMNALSSAPADGYTIAYTPVTPITIQPHRMKLAYRPDSFIPVCQTFENIFWIVVGPGSPHRNIADFVAAAKAAPGRFKYATPGIASSPHLAAAELFQRMGAQLVDVPYQTIDANTLQSVIKGDVEAGVITTYFTAVMKMHPLAVFANARHRQFPDTPTVAELGHPILPSGYGGVFVREGTPPAIVAKLDDACRRAATDPTYQSFAEKQYQVATYLDAKAFGERVAADARAKAALIPTLNLPAQ